ncbi:hypothetical protein PHLGIDRAFT_107482 [Phlebiopsis gigantea 11061_1 CR5-6]|uniref:Zn(2)-C6 fungal-type domain-containing protein n=1 Tax=Phlebiopsis gigantea (strain 11061_1 CR5-6) TaxID=745531 RepID=A0A0C3NLS0_PHLG1|nr:hypothetical protein PHLGIDRAFT_107482 [Phlebiopsis gigantea 11061_1 CR5-6]
MPKAQSPTIRESGPYKQNLNSLKRNQACHQCRKRKLKCDAQRPCSTCLRSHAYALSHASPADRANLPPRPDCTYDEDASTPEQLPPAPKTRYEKLESRINELEALLREKSVPSSEAQSAGTESPVPSASTHATSTNDFGVFPNNMPAPSPMNDMDHSLLWLAWPAQLPDPATTRHLIQAFFSHCIHATRLFHAPSFYASLNLLPSDSAFPSRAILHMMCAIGSMYTSSFPSGYIIDSYPVDPATRTRTGGTKRPQSFAGQHANYAKEAIEDHLECSERLFECLQGAVLLTWYYYSQARWIDSCLSSAVAMRTCVTMALNVCPPFQGLSATDGANDRPPSTLSPAKSVVQDEMRRNAFWLGKYPYTMDRQMGAGNGWAMNIDELDIHQLMPLRQDQWERGVLLLPPERQYSHGKDTLTVFPLDQTDPFIMYSKATILMSRVKNFCLRFRSLRYVGDPSVRLPNASGLLEAPSTQNHLCIRDTPAFAELNNLIEVMRTSFPPEMKNVTKDGKLEEYTYCAWNLIHLAQIHLHEPFANPGSQSCTSALSILTASRAIVDSLHGVTSTSFDVSLLDTMAFLCWYMAGRVLTRFLKAAQDNQAAEHLIPLKTEVSFIRSMLLRAGERIPLAYCYWKMLVGVIQQTGVEVEEQEVFFPHMSPPIVPQFQFAMEMRQTIPGMPVPA